MIELKRIRDLIKLMVTNELTELDLQSENERIALKRGAPGTNTQYVVAQDPGQVAQHHAAAGSAPSTAANGGPTGAPGGGTGEDEIDPNLVAITSPMVGSFYPASSPDAKPFIGLGDTVNEESVVCIIEAMKVFNEIKAEIAGTVEKILVKNGEAVEFGQTMFLVRPA